VARAEETPAGPQGPGWPGAAPKRYQPSTRGSSGSCICLSAATPTGPGCGRGAEWVHPGLSVGPYHWEAGWVRAIMHISNVLWTLFGKPDRYYIYRRQEVDGLMREAGFEEAYSGGTLLVQVVVYQRAST